MRLLVVGRERETAALCARLEERYPDVALGDPALGDLVVFLAAEGRSFDTVFFLGHDHPVTVGGIALARARAVLVTLVDDGSELDTGWRRYVFRLPRALAFRSEEEAELVRSRFDVAEKTAEILGSGLDDEDALARLIHAATPASRRIVAIYRPGRRWNHDESLARQPSLAEHMRYLARLAAEGRVESAGPFHELSAPIGDAPVGLVVFRSDDLDAVAQDVEADPAVRAGVIECDVLPWYH